LTALALDDALRACVSDVAMRERAAALGARIREEDGVARAVELLEAFMARGAARRP
jgi:UDP:flavonoid glycosyltransferase YjiC (YdhE family)